MAISFSYQGYYDFIDDYKAKDCRNVIMNSKAIQNTDYIQNENWVSSVIGYIDNTHYTQDPEHDYMYYYDIFDWSTDEKIGVMYCPDNAPDGSITINGTTYNFSENDYGLNIFDDGEDNKLYIFDDSYEECSDYFMPFGTKDGITNYYYTMLTENTDNHNFVIVFIDDGYLNQNLSSILDLTDDVEYYDPANDTEGTDCREIQRYDGQIIVLTNGCRIPESALSNICCAIPAVDEFGEDGALGLVDTDHFVIKDNTEPEPEPIGTTVINVYRSFWNKYGDGAIYGYRLGNEVDMRYKIIPMLAFCYGGEDRSKFAVYIDSTTNWNEYFEDINAEEMMWAINDIYPDEIDDYIQINVIDDPVGGEMMTRINMENRDRKLPKGGFA